MKILITDNEEEIRHTLKEMIQHWPGVVTAVEEADGVAAGLRLIKQMNPDIVLLDVEMNGETGFDLLKQLQDPTFQLIFVTAHNQYAIPALRYSAIDYVLKPIDMAELFRALDKAAGNTRNSSLPRQLSVLLHQYEDNKEVNDHIVLKDLDKTYFILVEDILFCEAEGAYTKFYLAKDAPVVVSKNLRFYEEMLAPRGFIRTHHSCLVNTDKIKIYDRKTDHGALILENGYTLPLSKRKKEAIIRFLENR